MSDEIDSAEAEELEAELEDETDVEPESELESAEPIEVLDLEEDAAPEPPEDDSRQKYHTPANPYLNTSFPIVFIDKKMKILFANKACETLFTGYFDFSGSYFVDIFGKSFGIDGIKKIHDTITNGKNGYFLKDEIRIKSRDLVSVQVKFYLFPAAPDDAEPAEFVIMFHNVTEENKKLTRSTFMSLLEASKLKDNDTGFHIIRVNYYSKRLAEELFSSNNSKYNRIDADFIDNIGFLASMHDVGKIGTPDDILNKEGPLSDWEWTVMREHTKNGAFILSTYPNPMAKEIALSHHERWDGTGYPYQLSGEMIPLAARIVTVADVYDALRMERSYKPALDHDITVHKMIEGKNNHFDPFLMEVFAVIEKEFEQIYEDNRDIK